MFQGISGHRKLWEMLTIAQRLKKKKAKTKENVATLNSCVSHLLFKVSVKAT